MLKRKRLLSFIMSFLLIFSFVMPVNKVKAESKYVEVTKTLSSTTITTKDEVEVTLGIKGTPPIDVVQPNDVILIMDKSGSMNGDKIIQAKQASKDFIDLMDLTTHRVGVVDFSASTGTLPLTTDANSIKNYIDTIKDGGGTDTAAAIKASISALSNHREGAQPVIIILTDGAADSYEKAKSAAKEAKDAGIVFYTVALLKENDNPDVNAANLLLKEMATTAQHHHFVLGSTGLNEIYKGLVKEIGITSVRDVLITDVVSPEFEIVTGSFEQNIPRPIVIGNTLTWEFIELKSDILNFTYKIRPKSKDVTGTFPVSAGSTIQYKDYLGNVEKLNIVNPNITINYPKPDIVSVTPDKNEITGGNEITIKGTDFRTGATVTVNSVAATNVQAISENEIKATVPVGKQGEAVIRVENTDGQYDEEKSYYFASPIVTTITPNKGLIDGGTKVSISGKYFLPGVKVFFNNIEATTTYLNGQSITAISPKSDNIGEVDVKVINTDGTETIVSNGFIYERLPAPIITSISLNEGQLAGGEIVDINGDNFKIGATVKVGGQDASKIVFSTETRIRILVPASNSEGTVDIVVTNPDGQVASLANAYTYLPLPQVEPPAITSLSSVTGLISGGEYVTVKGTGFQKELTVTLGGINTTVANYYNDTQIRIVIPVALAEGAVELVITNPDGQVTSLANAYTYLPLPEIPAPVIKDLLQVTGPISGGDLVTINGTGFQKELIVTLGGINATVVNYYSATKIRIAIPKVTNPGVVDLEITNPDGKGSILNSAYTYTVPVTTITSLSVSTGEFKGGYSTFIYGTNFDPSSVVTVNNVPVKITYYGNNQIKIIAMPSAEELGLSNAGGVVDIKVINSFGDYVTTNFDYKAKPVTLVPDITKITGSGGAEAAGPITGGTYMYFYGTGFTSTMKVRIYDSSNTLVKEEELTNFYSATYARKSMPKVITAGTYTIKLVNIDGIESNGIPYIYR